MANYIKEELNCLELKTDPNEDKLISYKCEPDNKAIGSVLKKAYDKKMKTEILKLSSAQLKDFLKNGSLMLGTTKIEGDWLRVEKFFNEETQKSKEWACASNMTSSVMLSTVMDDNLKQMGQSREITNRIQKLRKSTGISIDDKIEVFFSLRAGGKGKMLDSVLGNHLDKIKKSIKMPLMDASIFW